uniref:TGF-beta family profile domain-containing protein n=1 Tax=Neogobius melanostomus TaxID=47308 RepID=A0A8C6SK70_9GOBI
HLFSIHRSLYLSHSLPLRWAHVQTSRHEVIEEDAERRLVLEALKTGILSSLGMDKPPVVQTKATQTELMEMEQLYQEKLSELGLNATRTNWVSTLLLPDRVGPLDYSRRRHVHWHRAVFMEKPHIQDELSLIRAELHMSRQVLERASRKVKVHLRNSTLMRQAVWADVTSHGNVSQSIVLDVSDEVQKWIGDSRGSLEVDIGNRGAHYGFTITLKLTHGRSTRTARSVNEDECEEGELCCRQSVTVSFRDIGWTDWVVAPLEYTIMHTQVKSRMAQISKGGTPRPCCVPAEYQPMVIMHYDSRGKLKLTPFEDLIVSKCYCA